MMCNWLVCLAVWQATAAQDIAATLVGIYRAPPPPPPPPFPHSPRSAAPVPSVQGRHRNELR